MMHRHLTLVLLFVCKISFSQTLVTGKVFDQNDPSLTLPYATIRVMGTLQYTIADQEGVYKLALKDGVEHRLQVRYIGYNTLVVPIITNGENKTIDLPLVESSSEIEEVVVMSTRVDQKSIFSAQNFEKKQIENQNLGQDLPFLLNQATSVVVSSDAGNGVGYSGIRVRGSDPTRTNVTINGIPVNDAESQGVYWVNMPDLASSTQSIQIQRGVGTSTNGAGAFGATVNIQTSTLESKPYGEFNNSYGSFQTLKNTLKIGTGLLSTKWAFDARLSHIRSNGYIDRAATNLSSAYGSAAYYGAKNVIKLIAFGGKERTYQAWNGVLQDSLNTNRTYNYSGAFTTSEGNTSFHKDEVDNYAQQNFQAHWITYMSSKWQANVALHYTKGKGYFEQYKEQEKLSKYGILPFISGSLNIDRSDLIRRRWLDNHFVGMVASSNLDFNPSISLTLGGAYNTYLGDHFGEVIWTKQAPNAAKDQEYYRNDAAKNDANVYAKVSKKWGALSSLIDLQLRTVAYDFIGFDANINSVAQKESFIFFNPKFGLNYGVSAQSNVFASLSFGSKEPNRNDFTESSSATRPKPEYLRDLELGYSLNGSRSALSINAYFMDYKDQLILTGKINDVGEYARVNVENSLRTGLEVAYDFQASPKLNFGLNVTISRNKIANFSEFIDQYDTDYNYLGQKEIKHESTDIAFSPNAIGGATITLKPMKRLEISLMNKYVGAQYLDNTQNKDRSLNAYFTTDTRFTFDLPNSKVQNANISLLVNNLWNSLYESNGYSYGFLEGSKRIDFNYLFPQAGINGLLALNIRF